MWTWCDYIDYKILKAEVKKKILGQLCYIFGRWYHWNTKNWIQNIKKSKKEKKTSSQVNFIPKETWKKFLTTFWNTKANVGEI